MEIVLWILIFLIGLGLGSFVNMLVYRTEVKYGLRKIKFRVKNENRSYCDFCGRKLEWWENVPLLSWWWQAGRSRCCQKRLPLLYPIVELTVGLLLISSVAKFGSDLYFSKADFLGLLIMVIWLTAAMFSLVFDLKWMILPDFSSLLMSFLALFYALFFGQFFEAVLTAIGLTLFYFLLSKIKIRKSAAMGFGDVKLAAVIGLGLGWPGAVLATYAAFLIGGLVVILLLAAKKIKRERMIPFGPFMLAGWWVLWRWGECVLDLIRRWW